MPRFELHIRSSHFMQAIAQGSIYLYWGQYYFGVREWAPYILAQLLFAFLLDSLISVSRGQSVRIGFSVFPIVLSLNLFIWSKPEYFYLQLLMVATAVLSKAFLVRADEAGRRSHIFNPSALALALMSLFTLVFGLSGWFNTREVVLSYMAVPHFYVFVFLVGCLSHWVGRVSYISLAAIGTLAIYDFCFSRMFGMPPMESMVHQSIFVGITLLVTDPVTSPKSTGGQLLYGCLYGVGIAASHALLIVLHQPRYFDKILIIPLLNLLAPALDRWVRPHLKWNLIATRWAPICIYAACFFLLLPSMERKFYQITYIRNPPGFPPKADPRLNEVLIERWRDQCTANSTLPICGRL